MTNYPPTGYPAPQPGAPLVYAPAPPRGMSVASMVLGLVSIVFGFTFFLPLIGFILGIVGIRREPAGRGMAITGLILNGLFVIGWTLIVLAVIGVLGTAAVTSTTR